MLLHKNKASIPPLRVNGYPSRIVEPDFKQGVSVAEIINRCYLNFPQLRIYPE